MLQKIVFSFLICASLHAAQNSPLRPVSLLKPTKDLHAERRSSQLLKDQISQFMSKIMPCMKVTIKELETLRAAVIQGNVATIIEKPWPLEFLNYQDLQGKTALMLAFEYNQLDVAEMLIFFKVDLNRKDLKQKTALHYGAIKLFYAAMEGRVPFFTHHDWPSKLLNYQDPRGLTALMYAIFHRQSYFAQFLINNSDINLNTENEHGQTALDYAEQLGNQVIAKLIRSRIS